MYKYTPKPGFVKTIQRPEFGYKPSHWATVEHFITSHFPADPRVDRYNLHYAVIDFYPTVIFYSPVKTRVVPVRGFLFPSELFDETVITG